MSAMTTTIGTGLQGGANRSGYVYDGLTQYPDLAWSEGYVFRGGTGWWQEWLTIFPTYDEATASVTGANYATLGGGSVNVYASNAGTGWTEAFTGLFPSVQETDANMVAYVYQRVNFRNCPPFVGNSAPFVPFTSGGQLTNTQNRRACYAQTNVGLRPALVPAAVPDALEMSFDGTGQYYLRTGAGTNGGNVMVLFRTTSANTRLAAHVYDTATPANVGLQLGCSGGQSVVWAAKTTALTTIENPGPLLPAVTVNDGAIHSVSAYTIGNSPTFLAATDSTDQTATFSGNAAMPSTSFSVTLGCKNDFSNPFIGEIVEIVLFRNDAPLATKIAISQQLIAQW